MSLSVTAYAGGNNAEVLFKDDAFFVVLDGTSHSVKKYNVSGLASDVTPERIQSVADIGYFTVRKIGDEYALQFNLRICGGSGKSQLNYPYSYNKPKPKNMTDQQWEDACRGSHADGQRYAAMAEYYKKKGKK
jgi:hypothetical protein